MAADVPAIGADERLGRLLEVLEQMAGGDLAIRVAISPAHDELDAIAHGVNVLAGELQYSAADLRQAKERAEQANRAKTVFLRNVSHEIRTPLTAILSIVQLLESPHSEARRRELVQRIASNGRWLIGLVDDLLDLAKLESGKLSVNRAPLPALHAIEEVVQSLEPEAQLRGLQLVFEAQAGRDALLLADGKHVRQILTNLVGNAIKFTAHGRIGVRLAAELPGTQVLIDVSDTGVGLSQEQAEQLFEPFMQADRSIAQRFGGSGLGLALSRRLARAMDGDLVLLDGTPGAGAVFRLSLPAAPPSAHAPPATPGPLAMARADLGGLRLLLADDNEDIREATAALLTLMGARVVEVGDGAAAVERAAREDFDVVLMDVQMPRLDGLEATRRLRALGIRTPIVALTADAVLQHREECLAAGCTAHVAKPFDIGDVVAVLQQVWHRR